MFNSISATRCFALLAASLCACSGYNLQLAEPGACKADAAACGGEAGVGSGGGKDAGSVVPATREFARDAGSLVSSEEMTQAGWGGSKGGSAGGAGTAGAGENSGPEGGRGASSTTDAAAGSSGTAGHADPSRPSPQCGNGIREDAELCDGADCPSKCDAPASACIPHVLKGAAKTCDAQCVPAEITTCANGDQCCPKGCTYANDKDCSESCGDGVVSGKEKCEPDSADHPCPTAKDCNDGNVCTEDRVTGADCNAECTHTSMMRTAMSCDDGDPCTTDLSVESETACAYECVHTPPQKPTGSCADSDPCTDDTPVPSKTSCTLDCPHTRREPVAANCADSDPCTDDTPVMSKTTCGYECPHTKKQPATRSCADNNPCTDDTPVMSTTTCGYECPHPLLPAGTACDGGRMCSSAGRCEDPPPVCGDGKQQSTEECDDGHETWECDSSCHRRRLYVACSSGSECRDGQACLSGACTAICVLGPSGFSCPSQGIPGNAQGVICYLDNNDTTQGYCRPICRSAADCPKGLRCSDEVCLP